MEENIANMGPLAARDLSEANSTIWAATSGGTRDIEVDKDNVLRAAKIIQDALSTDGRRINLLLTHLQVLTPSEDLVSTEAARAWQERLVTNPDSHANRIRDYLDGLQELQKNLEVTARQYGYSEAEITDALNRTTPQ